MSKECYTMMMGAEKLAVTPAPKVKEGEEHEDFEEKPLNDEEEKLSGELYDILCQVCTSEALGVVKAVNDMQGMAAWRK